MTRQILPLPSQPEYRPRISFDLDAEDKQRWFETVGPLGPALLRAFVKDIIMFSSDIKGSPTAKRLLSGIANGELSLSKFIMEKIANELGRSLIRKESD